MERILNKVHICDMWIPALSIKDITAVYFFYGHELFQIILFESTGSKLDTNTQDHKIFILGEDDVSLASIFVGVGHIHIHRAIPDTGGSHLGACQSTYKKYRGYITH